MLDQFMHAKTNRYSQKTELNCFSLVNIVFGNKLKITYALNSQ